MTELWQHDVICEDFNFDEAIDKVIGQKDQEMFDSGYLFDQCMDMQIEQPNQESLLDSPDLDTPDLDQLLADETLHDLASSLPQVAPLPAFVTSEPCVVVESKVKSSSVKRQAAASAPSRPCPKPQEIPSSSSLPQQELVLSSVAKEQPEQPKLDLVKPKRSLSAYNFFFHDERIKLKAEGRIGFAKLARTIATKWKAVSQEVKMDYEYKAAIDLERYEKEYAAWKTAVKAAGGSTSVKRKASKKNAKKAKKSTA
mmetsp:Transcript_22473/g.48944  ORF Transcript_22473/g.48944 Transcript_22473/m.48944 type:complete len:255 (-) Transcript_22473:134-898(-)